MVVASTKGNASVVKAMVVLNAFSPVQPTLSVRQLAERTRLPHSARHNEYTGLIGFRNVMV